MRESSCGMVDRVCVDDGLWGERREGGTGRGCEARGERKGIDVKHFCKRPFNPFSSHVTFSWDRSLGGDGCVMWMPEVVATWVC